MTIKTKEITVGLGQLMLDPNNYRLNDGQNHVDFTPEDVIKLQPEIQQKLVKENIADLETSILKNGFLEVDKIVVKELVGDFGSESAKKFIVIEGNRRVAAFKSLITGFYDDEREMFFEDFPDQLKEKYKNINVILVEGNADEITDYSQRLMGIRHVSGPRQWGGYQSAKLINDMVDAGQDYKKISTLLGMRPAEAQRRHEAFLALMQMRANPNYVKHANPKLFSLFSEMVGGNKYFKSEWLGWNPENKRFENRDNLHRIYRAITPREDGHTEIKNPSRLRYFSKVVSTGEIRKQLESDVLLDEIDYDFDAEAREQKISAFIKFTRKLEGVSEAESELFGTLKESIESLLNKKGEQ